MSRKYFIAGNWKMNKTAAEATALIEAINEKAGSQTKVDVAVCPPFTALDAASKALAGSTVKLGAQNMYFEKSGAYTGEIAADMLKEFGCTYVILGHSERREYFKECNCLINKKVKAVLANGMNPILCVGEKLEEREAGKTLDIVSEQTVKGLEGLTAAEAEKVVIAYEPVWAIGTGLTATPDQAEEVCGFIRAQIAKLYDQETADAVTIQYGGSMNAKNCAELLAKPNIDGGLIGGASLKADDFNTIVQAAVNG